MAIPLTHSILDCYSFNGYSASYRQIGKTGHFKLRHNRHSWLTFAGLRNESYPLRRRDFYGPEGQHDTFGDLRRFVARAEASGSADDDELHIEVNENDEITGFSLHLDPDS